LIAECKVERLSHRLLSRILDYPKVKVEQSISRKFKIFLCVYRNNFSHSVFCKQNNLLLTINVILTEPGSNIVTRLRNIYQKLFDLNFLILNALNHRKLTWITNLHLYIKHSCRLGFLFVKPSVKMQSVCYSFEEEWDGHRCKTFVVGPLEVF
jgi:hypothetical protein